MGEAKSSASLTHLATGKHENASTQNQALSALLFLYREVLRIDLEWVDGVVRAKRPRHVPVVLSRSEARRVLSQMQGVPKSMAALLYGSGLRLMECAQLRIKDLDLKRGELTVRGGKGRKDRVTMLPEQLTTPLSAPIEWVHSQHDANLKQGAGRVAMPYALA